MIRGMERLPHEERLQSLGLFCLEKFLEEGPSVAVSRAGPGGVPGLCLPELGMGGRGWFPGLVPPSGAPGTGPSADRTRGWLDPGSAPG